MPVIVVSLADGLGLNTNQPTYPGAHDALVSDWIDWPPAACEVANSWVPVLNYFVSRIGLIFDTSGIGPGFTFPDAFLSLWLARPAHGSEDDPGQTVIHVVEGVPFVGGPADFGSLLPKTVSGGVGPPYADVLVAPGSSHDIALNANGRGWINPTGLTYLGLRLIGDIDVLLPTGQNDCKIYFTTLPTLTITYGVPPVISVNRSYALSREEL